MAIDTDGVDAVTADFRQPPEPLPVAMDIRPIAAAIAQIFFYKLRS